NAVAAIFNGAQVNQNAGANAVQSVAVGARNDVTITAVAGAIAGATAGVGAGGGGQGIRNNAIAFISRTNNKVSAGSQGAVNVDALSSRNILSVAIGVGAGGFGLGGGISVLSIGGIFRSDYTGQGENNFSRTSNALNQSDSLSGNDVLNAVNSTI